MEKVKSITVFFRCIILKIKSIVWLVFFKKVEEKVKLIDLKDTYRSWMQYNFKKNTLITVDDIIKTSVMLFQLYKVKKVYKKRDLLLFQYGTYDWDKGLFFEFNITRFCHYLWEDEPYGLSLTLYFDPIECKSYNCWSVDFEDLEKWVANIKETDGYKLVKNAVIARNKLWL
jgi:hypothetical protein